MANPNIQKSSPQTFGDLYTQIQEKNILTPEEENVFRDRAMQKYGMMGLLAKRQEAIGSNTRNELSGLLTGLPERDQILAKLDSMLPGYTPAESGQKITEQVKNTPKNIPSTPNIGSDLVKSLDGSVPAVTATVAGLGAAVVGTGLVTEKGWKTTLVENFGKFKDWIAGLLPENGIFAGLKDGIMKFFAKLGGGFGIKEAVADTVDKTKEQVKSARYGMGVDLINKFFVENKNNLDTLSILKNEKFASCTYVELRNAHDTKNYDSVLKKMDLDPARLQDLKKAMPQVLTGIFDGQHGELLRAAYIRDMKLPKGTAVPDGVVFKDYIEHATGVIKGIKNVPKLLAGAAMSAPLQVNQDGEINGYENADEKIETEKLFKSKKTLVFSLAENGKRQYKKGQKNVILKELENDTDAKKLFSDQESQKAMKEDMGNIFDFAEGFMNEVQSNPDLNLGLGKELGDLFQTKGFSFRGLTLAYVMMNGKTDFKDMTKLEQAQMYGLVMASADASGKGELLGKYTKAFRESPSMIPKGVWEFMSGISKRAAVKVGEGVLAGMSAFLGFAKEDPIMAGAFVALVAPIIPKRESVGSIIW